MLEEVRSDALSTPSGGGPRKVCYHSAWGDLYVWADDRGRVVSFQIACLEKDEEARREWWVEWNARGVRSGRVDSKEVDGRTHDLMTPVVELSDAAATPATDRARRFLDEEGGRLPADLRRFLGRCLADPRRKEGTA